MQILIIFFALAFGGVCLYFGISALNSQRRVRAKGLRTRALIIDFHVESQTQEAHVGPKHFRTTNYNYPIVRFTDEDGIETTQRLNYTDSPDKLNQEISILYIKHDEGDYEIITENTFSNGFAPQLFIGIGAIALVVGLVKLVGVLRS